MVGYIVSAFVGAVLGITLLLLHQASVKNAVRRSEQIAKREYDKLRLERDRLREDIQAYEFSSTAANARKQGKIIGIREGQNMTNYGGRRSVNVGGSGNGVQ